MTEEEALHKDPPLCPNCGEFPYKHASVVKVADARETKGVACMCANCLVSLEMEGDVWAVMTPEREEEVVPPGALLLMRYARDMRDRGHQFTPPWVRKEGHA